MLQFDSRTMIGGSTAAAIPAASTPRALAPSAQAIAQQPLPPAYSPIVLAGSVRIAEFALVMLAGLAVYAVYVVPIEGFASRYLVAVGVIAVLATLSFQAADIYQVQAFR